MWAAQFVSIIGSQMQTTAVNWQIYQLLRGQSVQAFGASFDAGALGLGLVGLSRVIPIVGFALLGGAIADAVDRRRVMTFTQIAAALFAGGLAVYSFFGSQSVWPIYLFTALGAATGVFDNPARQALVPNLVPKEHLTNAISMNMLAFDTATVLGPAIGGLLLAQVNIGWLYVFNAVSFLCVLLVVVLMAYREPPRLQKPQVNLGAMKEGLRFTFGTPIISSTMLLDFFATFFSSARTMLPVVASEMLQVGAVGYGLLSTAQSVGAVLAGLVVALRKQEFAQQGRVLLVCVGVYGLATALFGISTNFVLSYVLFAMTGAADTLSAIIRGVIRQLNTPDYLRGRMVGVNMMFFMGGPQLGELEAGLVAAAFGVPFAIVSGGVATVVLTGWVAWRFKALREYTRSNMPAAAH
jgi:MFS family permease